VQVSSRRRFLAGIIAGVWAVATAWLVLGGRTAFTPPLVVTHWANAHLTRPQLLPEFADRFNRAGYRAVDGRRIEVRVVTTGSAEIADELVARVGQGTPINAKLENPTLVSPQADHWLVQANYQLGRPVVDLAATKTIATTWIGIVTYREMAECLGWPAREIGFADIVALRNDPRGWAKYPCAKAEWGQRPLVAYTDPLTSTTGRSALFTLYAIAAGKSPDQLTAADVRRPEVANYVRSFQGAVDHYVAGTLPLNTQIYLGPRYGHFFFIPEDNLVSLYQGKESVKVGTDVKTSAITRSMVMLYPKEGSTQHNHSAAVVRADWVTPEQAAAAEQWITFLREEEQQRALMAEGLRPGTDLALSNPISGRYGLDPAKPTVRVNADRIDQRAMAEIIASWDEVKRPGVVTFVVDTSGSMSGTKINQARDGVVRALDAMSSRNRVGLLSFGSKIETAVDIAPLSEQRVALATTVRNLRVGGGTALYDAVKRAVEMTDVAPGDEDAVRGVVVLTDGQANEGSVGLSDVIRLTSRGELPVPRYRGYEGEASAVDAKGQRVQRGDLVGAGLQIETKHPVLVFFVGVGDADAEVGRLLAEATGASFEGATEKDLAKVIEQFGRYF
jgi:Ca-activated chloride channel family protein